MLPGMRRKLRRLFDESKPVYAQRSFRVDKLYERGDIFSWQEDGIDVKIAQRLFRLRKISHHPAGDGSKAGREALIRQEEKRLAEPTRVTVPTPTKASGRSRK